MDQGGETNFSGPARRPKRRDAHLNERAAGGGIFPGVGARLGATLPREKPGALRRPIISKPPPTGLEPLALVLGPSGV